MEKYQKGGKPSANKRLKTIKREAIKKAKGNTKQTKSGYKGDTDPDVSKITKGYASKAMLSEDSEYMDNTSKRNNVRAIRQAYQDAIGTQGIRNTSAQGDRYMEDDYDEGVVNDYQRRAEDILGMQEQKKVYVINKNTGQTEEHFINSNDNDVQENNEFTSLIKQAANDNGSFVYKGDEYILSADGRTPMEVKNQEKMNSYMGSTQRKTLEMLSKPQSTQRNEDIPESEFKKGGKMAYKMYGKGGKLVTNPKLYNFYDNLSTFEKERSFKLNGIYYTIDDIK